MNTDLLPDVSDIRRSIIKKYEEGEFVYSEHSPNDKLVELIGVSFIADEPYIIRQPNYDYIKKEIRWYKSQSLNIYDMGEPVPKIWKQIASENNEINSNYGWCVWSEENGNQYENALNELKRNGFTRRATMIYNRPSIHEDWCRDGMNDFICTYANSFFIRNGQLLSHYIMRSNDCVMGYNNDRAWARYIQKMLANDLGIEPGEIIWTASSLHVYQRHFKYLDEYLK